MKMMSTLAVIMVIFLCSSTVLGLTESKLVASDGDLGDSFGRAIAHNYEFLLVGAPMDGNNVGAVYVFKSTETGWVETQKLLASDAQDNYYFGSGICIDGDNALIGSTIGLGRGAAYLFHYNGTQWVEEQILEPSSIESSFSNALALHGNDAIIGTVYGGTGGQAYVFHYDGSTWTETQLLTGSDTAHGDRFGISVAMHGNYALIGADSDDDDGQDSGSAYVFQFNGSIWTETQKLTGNDISDYDNFGGSVAISDSYAFVGAPVNTDHSTDPGAAYVYLLSGSVWSEIQKLTASNGASNDEFGRSAAINGYYAVIGASGDDDNGERSGSVFLYELEDNLWAEKEKIIATDGTSFDSLGFVTSVYGGKIAAGAYLDINGSAYIYDGVYSVPSISITGIGLLLLGFALLFRRR